MAATMPIGCSLCLGIVLLPAFVLDAFAQNREDATMPYAVFPDAPNEVQDTLPPPGNSEQDARATISVGGAEGQAVPPPTGPKTLPYEDGQAIPLGYRLEQSRNRGLIVAGSIVLPVSYVWGLFLSFAWTYREGYSYGAEILVPVAGPWIFLAKYQLSCDQSTYDVMGCKAESRDRNMMMIYDGVAQAAGATLLIWGIASRRTRLVRMDVAEITIAPTLVRGGYGAMAIGRF